MDQFSLGHMLIFLAAAVVSVPISKRLGLGSVLGYLLAGMIIGPSVFGWIGDVQEVMHFSEFGVVLFMFIIGLEVNPRKLWELRRLIFGLGAIQVIGVAGLVAVAALSAKLSLPVALLAGFTAAMSSTAIALQTYRERNWLGTTGGQAGFAVLLFQDLAVIPLLAILPLLAPGVAASTMGWAQVGLLLLVIAGIVIAGRFLIRPLFRFVAEAHLREIFTALSLLLVLGMSFLMESIGLSMSLGAFLAGVLLAESEYRHALEADIEPFKGLFLGLFFISVGMSIQFGAIEANPGFVLGGLLAVLVLKTGFLYVMAKFFGIAPAQRLFFSFSLAQIGEFAFVLFGVAQALRILSGETASLFMGITALTMLATPLMLWWHDRYWNCPDVKPPADDIKSSGHPVIIAGFGRFGQVVGRFLFANKISATVLDHEPGQIELVRRFGFKVYYGDATRLDLLEAAGARDAKIIVVAVDGVPECLKIVDLVKENFPHLKIYARARNMAHVYELLDRGVQTFERETFEASLKMASGILVAEFGRHEAQAKRAVDKFRDHNIQTIYEMYPERKNQAAMVSKAQQARKDLERLFEEEQENLARPEEASPL